MRKKVALGFGVTALTLSAGLVAFNLNKSHVITEFYDNNSNIKTVSTSLDITPWNLDELNLRSEIIIKAKAIDQSCYTIDTHVFSKTKVIVEKVYKGNIKEGVVLNLVERGGITTEEEYNLKVLEEKTGKNSIEEEKAKARANKIRVLSGGIPYSEVGQNSLYFLKKASPKQFSNKIDTKTYSTVGIQGRFDVKNATTFERPHGIDNELPELKITELDLEEISKNK